MKCPQCGTEFEGAVGQCFTCGWEFRPRISKCAVFTFILGILSILVFPFFPLTYGLTVILSIIAFVKIRRSKGQLKGKWFAISGLVIPIIIWLPLLILWLQDAGHVPNEFTEADLLQVKLENEGSYDVLLKLCDNRYASDDVSAIGLNGEDEDILSTLYSEILDKDISVEEVFSQISENRQQVDLLWKKAKRGRDVIQQLAEYDEIAEFVSLELEPGPEFLMNLVNLDKLSCLYVLGAVQQGNDQNALDEFLQFDKVVRSLSIFSRVLVTKLGCLLSIDSNLRAANVLVNSTSLSDKSMNKIIAQFQPISHEHVSLKNHIVSEYISIKNLETKLLSESNIPISSVLKINSKNRYSYSFCRNAILKDEGKEISEYCELSVWPWEYNWPKLYFRGDKAKRQFKRYSCYSWYNPVGTLLLTFKNERLLSDEMFQKKAAILIHDDLFQWVLTRRMGQESSLKARAYSDEYTVDVDKGLVFSVGPDGVAYTDDDIKMRINPDILGL